MYSQCTLFFNNIALLVVRSLAYEGNESRVKTLMKDNTNSVHEPNIIKSTGGSLQNMVNIWNSIFSILSF